MTRPVLAIAIPTYRRAGQLLLNHNDFMREAAALGVPIHISDDSPDDEIARLAETAAATYGNVFYRRNTPSLGHDRNVVATLSWPDADHVWLLGDVFYTAPGGLTDILASLKGQDFQFVNHCCDDLRVLPPVEGQAAIELIRDRLWHQTLTGGTIYHRRVCDWLRATPPTFHANFPHLDIIMGYASSHQTSVSWFGRRVLRFGDKGQSYWRSRAFDVFVDDWVSVITAYPGIVPPSLRVPVLKAHSAQTRLFDLGFLIDMKMIGHLDWQAIRRRHFWDVMHLPRATVIALLLIPRTVMARMVAVKRQWTARR
jgi:hypothetical protein